MNRTKPFLSALAETLYADYGENIRDICLVFPNRRSGLFFKKYLASAAGKTTWSPRIFTISEFIQELTPLQLADPVDLVFEVYEIYRELTPMPESLDEFWSWGEMMISDFDDIDKYLVNADSLYSNIRDLKEIDSHFDLTEEQKETVRKFWGYFITDDLSGQKESFLKIWKILGAVYRELNRKLRLNGLAYEGMIYRELSGRIDAGDFPALPWDRVILCGFNALNKAEQKLFRYLRNSGKARFFWDYDKYYVNNRISEAGRFMRQNLADFPPDTDLGIFENIRGCKVNVYELPSDTGQAKFLNSLLGNEESSEMADFNHAAVILGDEDLLIPVLTSLPASTAEINITMGYPMSSTPAYSFADQLMKMQKNLSQHRGKRKDKFYYRDVLSILNHQFLKLAYEEKAIDRIREIHNRNLVYIEEDFFGNEGILKMIFRRVGNTLELTVYIREILLEIAGLLGREGKDLHNKLEKEYIFHLLTRLNKLKGIIAGSRQEVSIEIFSRVFRKILKNLRIPFEGEPLGGLQIMGILETRLLDFDHVYFLSMNEGVMPRAHQGFSYIPHNLRYAYGMPTREDQDAIYAYYFYRLLQRSSEVTLLYNSRADGVKPGEMSRYIYQLKYDPEFKVESKSVGFNISGRDALPISVAKSPEIFKSLERYVLGKEKYLSPSALNMYITCPLRFYFSYVAGLRELDTVSEEIEADTFGNLLHEAMYENYKSFKGKIITPDDIDHLLEPAVIKKILDGAFRKLYYKNGNPDQEVLPEGKNIIFYEVLNRYIKRILEIDREYAPFEIISLETEYKVQIPYAESVPGSEVWLGGKIDRIDKKDGVTRVIDYKTGKAEMKFRGMETLFDMQVKDRNKAVFQTMMYSWLYTEKTGLPEVSPGLYVTRKLFEPGFSPMVMLNNNPVIFHENKEDFQGRLKNLVAEIMDAKIKFEQTELPENCEYCPYAEICHRKVEKPF